jgi:hypothetical protein
MPWVPDIAAVGKTTGQLEREITAWKRADVRRERRIQPKGVTALENSLFPGALNRLS